MGIVCDWVSERFGEGSEGSRRAGRGGELRVCALPIQGIMKMQSLSRLFFLSFFSFLFFWEGTFIFIFYLSSPPPFPSHPPINAVGIVFLYCIVIVLYCYCYCISHSYCCNVFQKVGCFGWGDGVVVAWRVVSGGGICWCCLGTNYTTTLAASAGYRKRRVAKTRSLA